MSVIERAPTFWTMRIRIPAGGRVAVPGPYAHRFASTPLYWRHIQLLPQGGPKYVAVPIVG